MTKKYHLVNTVITWGMFFYGLFSLLITWENLPDTIGVHFSPSGSFDVYNTKLYAFYPHIVSLVTLLMSAVFTRLTGRLKLGLSLNKKGTELIRAALILLLDIINASVCLMFSLIWNNCVICRYPLNTLYPVVIFNFMFGSMLAFIVGAIVISVRFKEPKNNKTKRTKERR